MCIYYSRLPFELFDSHWPRSSHRTRSICGCLKFHTMNIDCLYPCWSPCPLQMVMALLAAQKPHNNFFCYRFLPLAQLFLFLWIYFLSNCIHRILSHTLLIEVEMFSVFSSAQLQFIVPRQMIWKRTKLNLIMNVKMWNVRFISVKVIIELCEFANQSLSDRIIHFLVI